MDERPKKDQLPMVNTGILGGIAVGSKITHQGKIYEVVEPPNEANRGKYLSKDNATGEIYRQTPEQLSRMLTTGGASLVEENTSRPEIEVYALERMTEVIKLQEEARQAFKRGNTEEAIRINEQSKGIIINDPKLQKFILDALTPKSEKPLPDDIKELHLRYGRMSLGLEYLIKQKRETLAQSATPQPAPATLSSPDNPTVPGAEISTSELSADEERKREALANADADYIPGEGLEEISIGSIISYQGEKYEVNELPSSANGNEYVLRPPGKPTAIPDTLTATQLTRAFESRKATLVSPEARTDDTEKAAAIATLKTTIARITEELAQSRTRRTAPTPPPAPIPPPPPTGPTGPGRGPVGPVFSPLEVTCNTARDALFTAKKTKMPAGPALQALEDAYQTAKIERARELVTNGQVAEAQEFLSEEVKLKRANDVENSSNFGIEKNRARISDTIEKWDKWGVEEKDSNGNVIKEGSVRARLTKIGISLVMIGAVSSFSVQKAAEYGWGTTSALGNGIGASLVQKLGVGLGIATFMEKTPLSPKGKKILQMGVLGVTAGAIAFSPLGASGLAAMGISSGLGYVASRFTRKYEGKIADRIKTVKEGTRINLANLDADVEAIEKNIEEALKRAETTRFVGKIAEMATAIMVSATTLELMGYVKDDSALEAQHEAGLKREAELKAENDRLEAQHQADLKHDAELKAQLDNAKNALTPDTSSTAPANALTHPQSFIDEKMDVVHEGEGIEHTLRRQIEHNPELAKALAQSSGFEGDLNDQKVLHEFSGGAAHRVALYKGYVDTETGEEIRVRPADEIAYKLTLTNNPDDPFKVEEFRKEGESFVLVEEHGNVPKFEGGEKEKYEYRDFAHHEPAHPAPAETHPNTENTFIKHPFMSETKHSQDQMFSRVKFGETHESYMPHTAPELTYGFHTTPEGLRAEALKTQIHAQMDETAAGDAANSDQLATTLQKLGYMGDPHDRAAVEEFFSHSRTPIPAPSLTPEQIARANVEAEYSGHSVPGKVDTGEPSGQSVQTGYTETHTGISTEDAHILQTHREFAQNHFDLPREILAEVYHAHEKIMHHLLPNIDESGLKNLGEMKAKYIFENKDGLSTEPVKMMSTYLHKLSDVTGLKPAGANIFHWRAENAGEFIARALQWAVKEDRLGEVISKVKALR